MRSFTLTFALIACAAAIAHAAACPSNLMGVGTNQVTSTLPIDSHLTPETFVSYNVPNATL